MESLLTKLWLWIIALIPAAIGSALSIYLGKDKLLGFTKWDVFFSFMFGISIAHLLGGAAIEYWHIDPLSFIASSIQVTIGFMGMATLAEAKVQIPAIISAIRKRTLGE